MITYDSIFLQRYRPTLQSSKYSNFWSTFKKRDELVDVHNAVQRRVKMQQLLDMDKDNHLLFKLVGIRGVCVFPAVFLLKNIPEHTYKRNCFEILWECISNDSSVQSMYTDLKNKLKLLDEMKKDMSVAFRTINSSVNPFTKDGTKRRHYWGKLWAAMLHQTEDYVTGVPVCVTMLLEQYASNTEKKLWVKNEMEKTRTYWNNHIELVNSGY
jgi:hypothetical protein